MKLPFAWCFLLTFVISSNLSAQQGARNQFIQDSLLAIEYFNIADTSYNNVDKCLRHNQLAIPLLKKTEQLEKYVYCLAAMSHCYNVKEYHDSMELNNVFAYQEAQKYVPPDSKIYMAAINNLGVVYSKIQQDHKKALELYKNALQQFKDSEIDPGIRGTLLNNVGKEYRVIGDFENAILYHQEALQYYRQSLEYHLQRGHNINFKFAEVYTALADLYTFKKKYRTAVRYLQEELDLLNQHPKLYNSSYYIYIYLQLADLAIQQDQFVLAASHLQQVEQFEERTNTQDAKLFRTLALLRLKMQKPQQAFSYIEQAILKTPSSQRIDLAQINHLKGRILIAQTKYSQAIESFDQAIALLLPTEAAPSLDQINESTKVLSRIDLLPILNSKAEALKIYFNQTLEIDLLKEAVSIYHVISSLSDQIRQNYQSEESKIFLNETTHLFYEEAISVAYTLYQITEEEHYAQQAFFFAEKSKSMALLDELLQKNAEAVFSIPDSIQGDYYRLRRTINSYTKNLLLATPNTPQQQNWNSKLLAAKNDYASLNEQLKNNYPDYYTFTRPQIFSIEQIQTQLLKPAQAFIEYFVGSQHIYAFVIYKKGALDFIQLEKPEALFEQVDLLLNDLKLFDPAQTFSKAAFFLHQHLISPLNLPPTIKQLLIVSDGKLAYLPFELLLEQITTSKYPRDWPFLLHKYYINYAYSATVLLNQQKMPLPPARVLALAPVFDPASIRHLEYSEQEVGSFKNLSSHVLLKKEANSQNFLQLWNQYEVLHISTHATAYDSLLQQPAIEFWDASISMTDLYTLNAHPQLVVLSACESGVGDFHKGESVLSLARGFTYAGAASIVTTLWKVNDRSTAEVMQHFYHFLKKGLSKDEALQLAKQEYLKQCSDSRSTPYYWASFLQLGDSRALNLQKQKIDFPVKTGIAILLLILFITWYQISSK